MINSTLPFFLSGVKSEYSYENADILQLNLEQVFARKPGKSHKDVVDGIKSVIGWIHDDFCSLGQMVGSI